VRPRICQMAMRDELNDIPITDSQPVSQLATCAPAQSFLTSPSAWPSSKWTRRRGSGHILAHEVGKPACRRSRRPWARRAANRNTCPLYQPASPSRPSPQGGRRHGSRHLLVDFALPIAGGRLVHAAREVHAWQSLSSTHWSLAYGSSSPAPCNRSKDHRYTARLATGSSSCRSCNQSPRDSCQERTCCPGRTYTETMARTGLAARTVAIARTTIVRAPASRRAEGPGAPSVHPAIPQSPSLEHVHWDGYVEVAQLPLQGQVPAGAACVHSMSLARWFVGTRPRMAPSEGAEPDWLLHAAKPARRSPTPHVDILNMESST